MLTGLAIGLTVLLWVTLRWSEHRFFFRWRPLGRRISDGSSHASKNPPTAPTAAELGWVPTCVTPFPWTPDVSFSLWTVTPFTITVVQEAWQAIEAPPPTEGGGRQGFMCNVPALLPPLWRRLVNRYHAKFFISHSMFTSPHLEYQDHEWYTPFGSEGHMQKAVFQLLDDALTISAAVEAKAQITVHEESRKLVLEVFWQVPSLESHRALKELKQKNPQWDFRSQGDFLSLRLILGWVLGQNQAV